jgi:hypothetical protein
MSIPFASFLDAHGPGGDADRQSILWWAAVIASAILLVGCFI